MVEDVKVGSVYSTVEFRLDKKSMSDMDKFEKRLDKIRAKITALQSSKNSVASSGMAGLASGSVAAGITGKTPLTKLTESIRKQEAFIGGRLVTLENKFRAVKLPTEEIDKARRRFEALSASYKAGKLLPQEFSLEMRKIGRDLSDMHKVMNVPPPKFSRDINAGWVSQIAKVAKAQDQMVRNVAVKTAQFEKATRSLTNLKPEQIEVYTRTFKGFVADLERAPHSINKFRTNVAQLDLDMRRTNGTTTFWGRQLKSLKRQAGSLQAALIPLTGVVVALGFQMGRNMDKSMVMFKTAFGADAAKEMAFLRRESDRLGISLMDNVRSYSKIAFSLKLMGIEGSKAKEVFTAFSEASLAFGMSQDDLSRAFKAIEQMYSKGTAQAEELRGQLTEAGIPGVWQIAAKAMGKTSAEFDKMITNREVQSADLIEKLSAALRELSAPGVAEGLKTIEPTVGKLKNTFIDISFVVYKNFLPGLKTILNIISNIVGSLENIIDPVTAVVGAVFSLFLGITEIITAFLYDLMNNPKALFQYITGSTDKTAVIQEAAKTGSTTTVKHEVVVAPSEQAKRDLDIKIKESHTDFWKDFDMNVG